MRHRLHLWGVCPMLLVCVLVAYVIVNQTICCVSAQERRFSEIPEFRAVIMVDIDSDLLREHGVIMSDLRDSYFKAIQEEKFTLQELKEIRLPAAAGNVKLGEVATLEVTFRQVKTNESE